MCKIIGSGYIHLHVKCITHLLALPSPPPTFHAFYAESYVHLYMYIYLYMYVCTCVYLGMEHFVQVHDLCSKFWIEYQHYFEALIVSCFRVVLICPKITWLFRD